MNQYLSSASLKSLAKGQLLGKYGTVIGAYCLHLLCTVPISLAIAFVIGTDTLLGIFIFSIANFLLGLFTGYFTAGESYIYLKIACNQPVFAKDLFYFFKGDSSKLLYIQAVLAGVSTICSLPPLIADSFMNRSIASFDAAAIAAGELPINASLFLTYTVLRIIGIIINLYVCSLLFSQVFYLMLDFPDYSAPELLKMSIRLMKGNKSRLFYIILSFVPLILLSIFSFGIALLWIAPYMEAVNANFYLDLIRKK